MAATEEPEQHVTTVRLAHRGWQWLEDLRWNLKVPRATAIKGCFAIAKRHETEVKKWIEEHR